MHCRCQRARVDVGLDDAYQLVFRAFDGVAEERALRYVLRAKLVPGRYVRHWRAVRILGRVEESDLQTLDAARLRPGSFSQKRFQPMATCHPSHDYPLMRTLGVQAIRPDGQITDLDNRIIDRLDSLRQRVEQRLRFPASTWFLNRRAGVPYNTDVLGHQATLGLATMTLTTAVRTSARR